MMGGSDNANGRIMGSGNLGSASNTVESCIAACTANNFTLAGMEYGGEYSVSYFDIDLIDCLQMNAVCFDRPSIILVVDG